MKKQSMRIWIIGGVVLCFFTLGAWWFVFYGTHHTALGSTALARARAYADAMPELPRMDNTNLVRPDYASFYRAHSHGVWESIKSFLGKLHVVRPPLWTPADLLGVLDSTFTRAKSYKVYKDVVAKIAAKPGTRFVIWGDLQGAYHSFVRGLEKLKEMGIIDDSLKVIAPDTYLIILGDAISRSPYGMETLTVILQLLEINAETVLYLRGNHEDNKYWEAFGLKDQIGLYCGSRAQECVDALNEFFMYLPLGLYLSIPDAPEHYVRISHLSREESTKLKEEKYVHFLEAPQRSGIDRHQIEKVMMQGGKTMIDAIVHAEKKRHTFEATDGLRLLPADAGAIAWTLVSSPTRVMQEGMKFYHDAFALITVGAARTEWRITLYCHDVRENTGFSERSYFFFSGQSADGTPSAEPQPLASVSTAAQQEVKTIAQSLPIHDLPKAKTASPFVKMLAGIKKPKPLPGVNAPVAIPLKPEAATKPDAGVHDNREVTVMIGVPVMAGSENASMMPVVVRVPTEKHEVKT